MRVLEVRFGLLLSLADRLPCLRELPGFENKRRSMSVEGNSAAEHPGATNKLEDRCDARLIIAWTLLRTIQRLARGSTWSSLIPLFPTDDVRSVTQIVFSETSSRGDTAEALLACVGSLRSRCYRAIETSTACAAFAKLSFAFEPDRERVRTFHERSQLLQARSRQTASSFAVGGGQ